MLALNSGSSSLKVALYAFSGDSVQRLAWGEAEEIGGSGGKVWVRSDSRTLLAESRTFPSSGDAARFLLAAPSSNSFPRPRAVGHRIVHGGPRLREHQRITAAVLQQLKDAIPFAPLHLPPALEVFAVANEIYADVPHVACFDTAFHRTMPEYAARLPFPNEYWQRGLFRYGFHGLSCESIVRLLGDGLKPRSVIAHLGNGCSITALEGGLSVETTMGLTPTGGVMMGTRSGDLDPGVILYLLREGCSAAALDDLLNHRSGLRGVSGASNDMRRLIQASTTDESARMAIEMFCYQIRKAIGAMAAVLGGMDLLIFAGGIGEHAASIRSRICGGLQYLGIILDESANQQNAARIHADSAACEVRVVPSDEDFEIAWHTRRLSAA